MVFVWVHSLAVMQLQKTVIKCLQPLIWLLKSDFNLLSAHILLHSPAYTLRLLLNLLLHHLLNAQWKKVLTIRVEAL